MRMRKKKHLDERLEACGDYFIKVMTDDLNFETSIETKEYFDFKELFGNDVPSIKFPISVLRRSAV